MIEDKMMKVNEYSWKGKKINNTGQSEKRMMDMNAGDLSFANQHCNNMLHNTSKDSPGRYLVLNEIDNQMKCILAELCHRFFLSKFYDNDTAIYSSHSLFEEIQNIIKMNPDKPMLDLSIDTIYSGLPAEYRTITIDYLIKATKDLLGAFNKKHITRNFIFKHGLWLTDAENHYFETVEQVKSHNLKLSLIKDRLGLPQDSIIRVDPRGFNYDEFKSMLELRGNKKYSDLTTKQLETLKNKGLYLLRIDVLKHIEFWEEKRRQLQEVAQIKNIQI